MSIKKLSIAGLCFLLTACQQTGQNNSDNQNNNTTDSVVTTKSTNTNEGNKASLFTSPDAALLNLRGNVKDVTIKGYSCDNDGNYDVKYGTSYVIKYSFDDNGNVVFNNSTPFYHYHTYNKKNVVRNGQGQLVAIGSDSTSGDTVVEHWSCRFEYDELGRPENVLTEYVEGANKSNLTTKFSYNEQGVLTSKDANGASKTEAESCRLEDGYEYEILEKDDTGNWTKRMVVASYHAYCGNNDESGEEEGFIEVREVNYR